MCYPNTDIMTHMMVDSDNMAANVMIDFLGGLAPINREIRKLGCTGTFLERKLMDTDALAAGKDNMTSVDDLGGALIAIYNGKLISSDADKQMLKIMAQNKNHEKLPAKVTNATEVYNKTGEFAQFGVENDAAIFVGKRHTFVVAVMSQNGHSQEQIQAESDLGEQLATLMLPTA
ncbi:serine hydrolase [Schleiferilactobacillus shenzhenensis]|nr:serine hydrolase [Schleiferilactobacillus shenzhenensis]